MIKPRIEGETDKNVKRFLSILGIAKLYNSQVDGAPTVM
jgi:hypothetical protein